MRILSWRKKLDLANVPYAIDSGGFTELNLHGTWLTSEAQYADNVHRVVDKVGHPVFVSPQDWVCGAANTGKTVQEHQHLTVENWLRLRKLIDSSLYLLPVIQGLTLEDYLACVQLYQKSDVDLTTYPIVGLGSIARRQRTNEGIDIIKGVANRGINVHGFGLKTTSLLKVKGEIVSADSMTWSYAGRRLPDPAGKTSSLSNSFDYMLQWYRELECKLEERLTD
jgi:hypothetical protein